MVVKSDDIISRADATKIAEHLTDPSSLTTSQLMREIEWVSKVFNTKIDAMQTAVELLQSIANKSPTVAEVDLSVKCLQELVEEKFQSIDVQLRERDIRFRQVQANNQEAVGAALAAAKEGVDRQNSSNTMAISKSEVAFTKQLDQMNMQLATIVKSLDDKISDIKERLTVMEAKTAGISQQRTEQKEDTKANVGYIVAGFGVLFGLVSIAIPIFVLLSKQAG